MRLFIAVELDSAVAAATGALVAELRNRAARLAPRARITWVAPERLHLTVRFIGNVDDERADAIGRVMSAPVTTAPFEIRIAGIGAFPRSGKPQVLWAGIAAGEEALQRVEREVTDRLLALGIPAEERQYRPHLTLARVRDAAGLRAPALVSGLERSSPGATWCEAITLFESRLSPKGPAYVPRQRTLLGG